MLRIEAKKPFVSVHKPPNLCSLLRVNEDARTSTGKCTNSATLLGVDEDVRTLNDKRADSATLLRVIEDVRTLDGKRTEWAQEVRCELQTEDGQQILQNIRLLRRRFEPEVVAKDVAFRSRRGKAGTGVYRARLDDAPYHSHPPM